MIASSQFSNLQWQFGNLAIWQLGNIEITWQLGNLAILKSLSTLPTFNLSNFQFWQFGNLAIWLWQFGNFSIWHY